jgi:hypothetical protein
MDRFSRRCQNLQALMLSAVMTDRDSYRSCPGKTCPGPDFLRIAGVGRRGSGGERRNKSPRIGVVKPYTPEST